MMSRTYAQLVSGVTMKMDFDPTTKDFTLQYYNNRMCTTNTTEVSLAMQWHSQSTFFGRAQFVSSKEILLQESNFRPF